MCASLTQRIGPEWLQENTGDVPAELGEFDSLPRLRVRVTDKDGRTLSGKWVFAMLPLMGGYRISDYQVGDYFRQYALRDHRERPCKSSRGNHCGAPKLRRLS